MAEILRRAQERSSGDVENLERLHEAARRGQIEVLKQLAAKNVDFRALEALGQQLGYGTTALHLAVENNHLGAVEILVQQGVDVNARDRDGQEPLYYADPSWVHRSYKLHIVGALLEQGAKVSDPKNFERIVKKYQQYYQEIQDIELAFPGSLDRRLPAPLKINFSAPKKDEIKEQKTQLPPETPEWELHQAAKAGDIEAVQGLLDDGIPVDAQEPFDNRTALHLAAERGRQDVANLLLNQKANIKAQDKRNNTPLHLAVLMGHIEMVKMLLKKGADVNAANNALKTPLHIAAEAGDIKIIKILLEHGAIIHAKDSDDMTALLQAERCRDSLPSQYRGGLEKSIAYLQDYEQNLQQLNAEKLHQAAQDGDVKAVRALLRQGVWADAQESTFGRTALHSAIINGQLEVIELLLEAGADINIDYLGDTPLHLAINAINSGVRSSGAIVKKLLEHGADVRAKDELGKTALENAREYHSTLLSTLLSGGHSFLFSDKEKRLIALTTSIADLESHEKDLRLKDNKKKAASQSGSDSKAVPFIFQAAAKAKSLAGSSALPSSAPKKDEHKEQKTQRQRSPENQQQEEQKSKKPAATPQQIAALHQAARAGKTDDIEQLLAQGVSIDASDEHGNTALHIAVMNENLDSVEYLLLADADAGLVNQAGKKAIECGDPDSDVVLYMKGVEEGLRQAALQDNPDLESVPVSAHAPSLPEQKVEGEMSQASKTGPTPDDEKLRFLSMHGSLLQPPKNKTKIYRPISGVAFQFSFGLFGDHASLRFEFPINSDHSKEKIKNYLKDLLGENTVPSEENLTLYGKWVFLISPKAKIIDAVEKILTSEHSFIDTALEPDRELFNNLIDFAKQLRQAEPDLRALEIPKLASADLGAGLPGAGIDVDTDTDAGKECRVS